MNPLLAIFGIVFVVAQIKKKIVADEEAKFIAEVKRSSEKYGVEPTLIDTDLMSIEFYGRPLKWCKCGSLSSPRDCEEEYICPDCHTTPTLPLKPYVVNRIAGNYKLHSFREEDTPIPDVNSPVIVVGSTYYKDKKMYTEIYELTPLNPSHLILFGVFVEEAWRDEEWNGVPLNDEGLYMLKCDYFRMLGYRYEEALDLINKGFSPWN